MRSLRAWVIRLMGLFRNASAERDFSAELQSHLDMHVADNLRAGMRPEEARRHALISLGGVEPTRQLVQLAAGVAIGLLCVFAWDRAFYTGVISGTRLTDVQGLIGAAGLLLVLAALACLGPVLRATHVNPAVALRYE